MSHITIKSAEAPKDAAILASLAKEIWTQHYMSIIGQAQIEYMLSQFQSKEAITKDIAEGCIYYIAYFDDVPCGYSAVQPNRGVFLSKFYVRQDHRGKGIGRAMLCAILNYAKDIDADRIWLTCNKHNTDSIAAYKKLGFSVISDVITDIGGGFVMDDYVLEKALDQAINEGGSV